MKHLKSLVWVFVAAGVFVLATWRPADAQSTRPWRTEYKAISALTAQAAYNGGIWTGWIPMRQYRDICFAIYNDHTGNTGVTFTCEGTDDPDNTTAGTDGFAIQASDIAGGTVQGYDATFAHTTGAADDYWVQCVEAVPYDFINCQFDDEAGNNATDDITVTYSLQEPR